MNNGSNDKYRIFHSFFLEVQLVDNIPVGDNFKFLIFVLRKVEYSNMSKIYAASNRTDDVVIDTASKHHLEGTLPEVHYNGDYEEYLNANSKFIVILKIRISCL